MITNAQKKKSKFDTISRNGSFDIRLYSSSRKVVFAPLHWVQFICVGTCDGLEYASCRLLGIFGELMLKFI